MGLPNGPATCRSRYDFVHIGSAYLIADLAKVGVRQFHFSTGRLLLWRWTRRLLSQRSQDSHSLQRRPSRARHDRLSQPNRMR
jgi:hypothetical protein